MKKILIFVTMLSMAITTLIPAGYAQVSLGEAAKFALLAKKKITSPDNIFAVGKVGAKQTIDNTITASDSILAEQYRKRTAGIE